MDKKKEIGRPKKEGERKTSITVSIFPTQLKRIEKRYGSLTKYLTEKMIIDNI